MKGKSQIKRFLFKINHKQLNIRLLKFMYLIKINKAIFQLEPFLILSLRHGSEKINQVCSYQSI